MLNFRKEQTNEPQNDVINQASKKTGLFWSSIGFIKQHWLKISIITILLGASITTICLIPSISVNNIKLVNLDTTFRLEKGQTAKLKFNNVSVKIINFVDATCPKNATCFYSGQDVEYNLIIDGQIHATGSITKAAESDYQIETVSSDYKTYANIKIVKSE